MGHNLQEVGRPRLTEIRLQDKVNINDSISDNDLEEPAKKTTNTASQNDGPWRCDIGVGAFFTEMERSVIATEEKWSADIHETVGPRPTSSSILLRQRS